MKHFITFFLLSVLALNQNNAQKPYSSWFADSEMARRPDVYGKWDYVSGTVLRGFEEVWRHTGEQKYFDYIKNSLDFVVSEDGSIKGYDAKENNIDEICEGRMLIMLYEETGEEKYKTAAQTVRKQFEHHPRTSEGGFWHKEIYPWQMWLDGLYMGSPFYTEYSKVFKQEKDFDDVTNQFLLIKKHLYDPNTGLFFHAWDESKKMAWANKETGLSQCFWGRGLGWYAMALVDVLEDLPEDHKDKQKLVAIIDGLATALGKYQDKETGLWWQVLDQGDRYGNYHEGSASSMFVYAIAKAVRMGWIDKSHYKTAKKGFEGLTKYLVIENPNGWLHLTRICRSAGVGGNYSKIVRDGSFNYYAFVEPIVIDDGKGTGPFLMASVEIEKAERK